MLKVEKDSVFRSLCNLLNITRLVISDLSFINRGRIPLPSTRFPSRRAWRTSSVDGIFLSQKELHVSTKNALSPNVLSSIELASDSGALKTMIFVLRSSRFPTSLCRSDIASLIIPFRVVVLFPSIVVMFENNASLIIPFREVVLFPSIVVVFENNASLIIPFRVVVLFSSIVVMFENNASLIIPFREVVLFPSIVGV